MLEPLVALFDERHGAGTPMVALLNDTGGCSTQELGVLARDLLVAADGRSTRLVGPSALMTSVDMHGFSVTLLPASEEIVEALASPVGVPEWPGARATAEPVTFAPRVSDEPDWGSGVRDQGVHDALTGAAQALRDARARLDELDALVGDGDAGSTIAQGASAVLEALEADRLSTGSAAALTAEIGALVERRMGGSSGVVISILLTATAGSLEAGDDLATALRNGLTRVHLHGDAEVGGRTMVDALDPAVSALPDLQAAARAAREGADATAGITSTVVGRSSYLRPDVLDGVVDAGAEAVALVLEAWATSTR